MICPTLVLIAEASLFISARFVIRNVFRDRREIVEKGEEPRRSCELIEVIVNDSCTSTKC